MEKIESEAQYSVHRIISAIMPNPKKQPKEGNLHMKSLKAVWLQLPPSQAMLTTEGPFVIFHSLPEMDGAEPYINLILAGVDGPCQGGWYPITMRYENSGPNAIYPARAPAFEFRTPNGMFETGRKPCISNSSWHQNSDGSNSVNNHPLLYIFTTVVFEMVNACRDVAGGMNMAGHNMSEEEKIREIEKLAGRSIGMITNKANPEMRSFCKSAFVDGWSILRRTVVPTGLLRSGEGGVVSPVMGTEPRFFTYLEPFPTEEEQAELTKLGKRYMPYTQFYDMLDELGAVAEINRLAATCAAERKQWLIDWESESEEMKRDASTWLRYRMRAWGKKEDGEDEGCLLYFPIPDPRKRETPEWIVPFRDSLVVDKGYQPVEIDDDFGF